MWRGNTSVPGHLLFPSDPQKSHGLVHQDPTDMIWSLIPDAARWSWLPRDYQFFLLSLHFQATIPGQLSGHHSKCCVSSVRIHLLQGVGDFSVGQRTKEKYMSL